MTKSSLWQPKRRIEVEYARAIRVATRKLVPLINELDNPSDIISRLYTVTENPWFQTYAEKVAMKMVTHLFTDSGRTWRQAAQKNSKGRMIYKSLMEELNGGPLGFAFRESVLRNAQFIRSVPADIARQMTDHIATKSMEGLRSEQIANDLLNLYPHISDVKANLIARTETAKTATALTQSRCEIQGIQWYQWHTSEDKRVRDSHRIMDKVLVSWSEPPNPEKLWNDTGRKPRVDSYGSYAPGGTFNCRCYASPIVDLDVLEWPAKIFVAGRIRTMSRREFAKLYTPEINAV